MFIFVYIKTNKMKTNKTGFTYYDKLFNVLRQWYTEKQIEEIWKLLDEYDNKLKLKQTK